MARRRKDEDERERTEQAPMLGVLSVLLLLIPALMLMAHVTAYAQIDVSTPMFGGQEPRTVIACGRNPRFQVAIAHGSFFTRVDGDPWRRAGATAAGYDHEALADAAWAFKQRHPHSTVAYVSAQDDVDYGTLVAVMDTLRGRDCELAGVLAGEEPSPECMLYDAVVEHRVPDWDVPEFRREGVWPPEAPRALGSE